MSDNGATENGILPRRSPNRDPYLPPAAHDVSFSDNATVPKPKRLACMICRRRKLKCDGGRPSCSTCSRLGHSCAYDEQRRKSGPKRGYVKALEERLKQVETLLKSQDSISSPSGPNNNNNNNNNNCSSNESIPISAPAPSQIPPAPPSGLSMTANRSSSMALAPDRERDPWQSHPLSSESPQPGALDDFAFGPAIGIELNNDFTWEMIGLGLEEPLPPQETIDELHQLYFEKVHPSMPMIHKYRYLAAMNLAPNQRPPVCLRYAMWTLACSITDKYFNLKDLFYRRARKYVEADYVKGFGEHMISVAHCQTHILLACYEMKMMYFPRAWVNTGSAVRLALMIGLHHLDGAELDVKQCLPAPRDWTEREERRRTFWMAFCEDRYASMGTAWPMTIDERDIMTNLPASEEAFEMSRPEKSQSLSECDGPSGAENLSSFGSVILLASLFGRSLIHLHRPGNNDLDGDLNGPFWKRHRQLDSILLNTSLGLPPRLKIPAGLPNPNVIFTHMSIHTSTICLHQAAIFKAERNKLLASVSSESKLRCITAANEIATLMRTVSHMDLSVMNPFISFCLYVSARVFVQFLKSRPDDVQSADSLRFLLSAMNALKRRNPLTESFLAQLDVDFEALAARVPKLRNMFNFRHPGESPVMSGSTLKAAFKAAACNSSERLHGILAYHHEWESAHAQGDDAKMATAPVSDLGERSEEPQGGVAAGAAAAAAAGGGGGGGSGINYGPQTWLTTETTPVPVLTPSSGTLYEKMGDAATGGLAVSVYPDGNGGDRADGQASPEQGPSNGITPKSSGAGSDSRSHLPLGGSLVGRRTDGSFRQSPVSGPKDVMNHGGGGGCDDGGCGTGPPVHQAFFSDASGFAMPATLGGSEGGTFTMAPNGWGNLSDQQAAAAAAAPGMPPVGEGVLRALMGMGSMETMDLSTWETDNGSNMRA